MRIAITILCLLLFPLMTVVASDIPQPIIDALLKEFPRYVQNSKSIAIGDLNHDGIPEVVTFLGDPQDNVLKIGVLTRADGDGYKVLVTSPEFSADPRGFYFLKIEKQSLYLLTSCCSWSSDYQFKMHNGDIVLIGKKWRNIVPVESKEPDTGESINYLTGEAIVWSKVGKRYTEKRAKFSAHAPSKLKDFDLDSHLFDSGS